MDRMLEVFFLCFYWYLTIAIQNSTYRFQMAGAIVSINEEAMDNQTIEVESSLRKLIRPMSLRLGASREYFHVMTLFPQSASGGSQGRFRPTHEIATQAKGDDLDSDEGSMEGGIAILTDHPPHLALSIR